MNSEKFDLTDPDDNISTVLSVECNEQLIAFDQQDLDENGDPIEGQFSTVVLNNDQFLTVLAILWPRTDADWYLIPDEETYSVH